MSDAEVTGLRDVGAFATVESAVAQTSPKGSVLLEEKDNSLPMIAKQPVSVVVDFGKEAVLSVEAGGKAPLRFLWFKDGNAVGGATKPVLRIEPAAAVHAGKYQVYVTSGTTLVKSAEVDLTVNMPPVVVTQPLSRAGGSGSNMTLAVGAELVGAEQFIVNRLMVEAE